MAFFNKYPYTDFHELNLDWCINQVKLLVEEIKKIDEWQESVQKQYEELLAWYDRIVNGDFPESVQNAFKKWCQENLINLVGEVVKNVFFGLTDSGYFVAYIPESWNDIIFNTSNYDIDIPDTEYGRLILSY